jgi:hypothetical protein
MYFYIRFPISCYPEDKLCLKQDAVNSLRLEMVKSIYVAKMYGTMNIKRKTACWLACICPDDACC